jgi:hypothetical protein
MKYIHGSEDSIDVDVYYVVDSLPSFQECQDFCSDKEENRNLIVIKDGIVTDCYKGTVDEINNGLFYTYQLHPQTFPNPILRLVERDILIKSVRVLRCIISHLSRTQYRNAVKLALTTPEWQIKVNTLSTIDITTISDFGKNRTKEDVLKVFAFQLGQILALHENIELYTKSSIATQFSELKDFLYRQPGDLKILQSYITKFLDIITLYKVEEIERNTHFKDFNKRIDLKTEKYL